MKLSELKPDRIYSIVDDHGSATTFQLVRMGGTPLIIVLYDIAGLFEAIRNDPQHNQTVGWRYHEAGTIIPAGLETLVIDGGVRPAFLVGYIPQTRLEAQEIVRLAYPEDKVIELKNG